MTATLTLRFLDGTTEEIPIESIVELDVKMKSVSFHESRSGWVMSISKSLTGGRTLADEFLNARKDVPAIGKENAHLPGQLVWEVLDGKGYDVPEDVCADVAAELMASLSVGFRNPENTLEKP